VVNVVEPATIEAFTLDGGGDVGDGDGDGEGDEGEDEPPHDTVAPNSSMANMIRKLMKRPPFQVPTTQSRCPHDAAASTDSVLAQPRTRLQGTSYEIQERFRTAKACVHQQTH
jgi:hypothetical protein